MSLSAPPRESEDDTGGATHIKVDDAKTSGATVLERAHVRGEVRSLPARRELHAEEAARASGFGGLCALLCIVGLGFQWLLHGVPWLDHLFTAGVSLLGLTSAIVWWRARDPARYTARLFRIYGVVALLVSAIIQYYGGVFSTAGVVVTLGISFFALSDDGRFALAMCLTATAFNLILVGGITLGWIPDLGLYRADSSPLAQRIFTLSIVPAVYLVTIWQARLSRRATHMAMDRLDEALRLARQREAQLDEANQNLDVALDAAAGGEGRFSRAQAGRFRLGEVVGRGAFGEVYAARDDKSGERAAVKVLVRYSGDIVKRFLREAEMLSRFRAPNVVSVFEVGELVGGAPYITMELLEGHNLAWHLRRQRQLEPRQVAWMTQEVATGLRAAHAAGIVHRDIKPQNLFLARNEDRQIWKILDFGVAKLRGTSDSLTHGAVIGTPAYMSPEQARGQEADPRSDVFSLAAVVYRALAGRPPFSNRDTPQLLFDIAYRIPSRPGELATGLPSDVDLVLAMGLAKRRADRFAGVVELASALEAALRDQLPIPLRARGQALVDAQPWGRVITQG